MPFTRPPYPPHALTTYELSRYRENLERALAEIPNTASERRSLRDQLADVLIEEKSRARLRDAIRC